MADRKDMLFVSCVPPPIYIFTDITRTPSIGFATISGRKSPGIDMPSLMLRGCMTPPADISTDLIHLSATRMAIIGVARG